MTSARASAPRRSGGPPTTASTWELVGTVWDAKTRPEWAYEAVPGVSNFWAPEVIEHDGTFYLYYSASTFGSNSSAIGLTTNTTLDPDDPDYAWVDQGEVLAVGAGGDGLQRDRPRRDHGRGRHAVDGVRLVLGRHPAGRAGVAVGQAGRPVREPTTIASRTSPPNAIEAPYLVLARRLVLPVRVARLLLPGHRLDLQHRRRALAGRHRSVRRPVRQGHDLDGGEQLLPTTGDMVGPGGQSVSAAGISRSTTTTRPPGATSGWRSVSWRGTRRAGRSATTASEQDG